MHNLIIAFRCTNPECRAIHALTIPNVRGDSIQVGGGLAEEFLQLCEEDARIDPMQVIGVHVIPTTEPTSFYAAQYTPEHNAITVMLSTVPAYDRRLVVS